MWRMSKISHFSATICIRVWVTQAALITSNICDRFSKYLVLIHLCNYVLFRFVYVKLFSISFFIGTYTGRWERNVCFGHNKFPELFSLILQFLYPLLRLFSITPFFFFPSFHRSSLRLLLFYYNHILVFDLSC